MEVKRIASYKILTAISIIAVVVAAFAGLWVAQKKSAATFNSKLDKLMFDTVNKSPSFVLTLPTYDEMIKKQQSIISAEVEFDNTSTLKTVEEKKPSSLEEVVNNIPNLRILKDKEQTQTHRYVDLLEDLSETTNSLLLPKIASDGRKPWNEYGKSVEIKPNFKKVAVIIKGLGFDPSSLEKIAKSLDSEVSISLSPYAINPEKKILQARQLGHETYVDLLLSSKDFLKADSGPMSMSITITKEDALQRLRKSLATSAPIGGVVINDGVADESNSEIIVALLTELKNRGLAVIDATNGTGIDKIKIKGLARKKADIVIDKDFKKESIEKKFKQAEDLAFSKGHVLVVIDPKPIAIVSLYKWIETFSPQVEYEEAKNMELTKPFALVPVSNLVIE